MAEKKIIIQILPVAFAFIALAKQMESVIEAIKDGVTEDEWNQAIKERDAALDEVIRKASE